MSKMSDIAMQLDESAVELGFADHLEAMANGYDWAVNNDGTAYLFKLEDEQQKAHEAWLKEKDKMLSILKGVQDDIAEWLDNKDHPDIKDLGKVIIFIKEQCHD